MTPQQAAEAKYPYDGTPVFDGLREAYIAGLQDAPQLSRSVLEEVRERCAEAAFKSLGSNPHLSAVTEHINNLILSVNLDDLLPIGDGWIDVNDRLPTDFIPVNGVISVTKKYQVYDKVMGVVSGWLKRFDIDSVDKLDPHKMGDTKWEDVYYHLSSVTHYRELPTPPKTVKNKEV